MDKYEFREITNLLAVWLFIGNDSESDKKYTFDTVLDESAYLPDQVKEQFSTLFRSHMTPDGKKRQLLIDLYVLMETHSPVSAIKYLVNKAEEQLKLNGNTDPTEIRNIIKTLKESLENNENQIYRAGEKSGHFISGLQWMLSR